MNTPFRYDFVGSFLRPQKLKDARKNFEEGTISQEKLTAVEDECILELVAKIKELGYHVITDGEFRRSTWHLDFMWGFEGIEHQKTVEGNTTLEIYGSEEAFAEDVIKAYGEFVQEIYAAGCRNLQFDDCVWGGMVDAKMAVALTGRTGQRLEDYKKLLLELNNQVVAQAPEDLVINTHVCRGNYHSTFFSSGAYDSVADLLFGEENVNAYYLEYDDKRSGGFAPLAKVSGDKKVVLGLITTKTPELENKEKVIARIHEAAKYVPLDRLYLSPQCGFASCEIGNKLTEEEQWAKLKLVKEIADEVWSDR